MLKQHAYSDIADHNNDMLKQHAESDIPDNNNDMLKQHASRTELIITTIY